MEYHGSNCSGVIFIIMVMAMMQLVLRIFSLGLFLIRVTVLDSSIFINALLMISIFNRILQFNVMGILSEQEHVFREDIQNHKDV